MRLRIIGFDGNRSVFVDVDENKPFRDSLPLIEDATNNPTLFQAFDLYPSVYVDESHQKIRCVFSDPVRSEALPRDLNLSTGTLVLREKQVGSASETYDAGSPEGSPSEGHSPSYRERLWAIYSTYEPEKLRFVEGTLQKYKGREEAVIKALVQKYGPEPDLDSIRRSTISAEALTAVDQGNSLPLYSPVSGQSMTPTIGDLDLLFAPVASPKSKAVKKKSSVACRVLVKWSDTQNDEHSKRLLVSYFAKWIQYRDKRFAEQALEHQVWRRSVRGFQLMDNTNPQLEVDDLVQYVRSQRIARQGYFSDKLQIALRELISTVTHIPNPLEITKERSKSSALLPLNVLFSSSDYSVDDYNPVRDTEKTARAVKHSARLLQYYHHRQRDSEEQEYKQKYYQLEKSYQILKGENQKLVLQQNSASAPVNSTDLSETVSTLEMEVDALRTKLKDSKDQYKRAISEAELQCEEKNKIILKLQHELAKVRTSVNKHKEGEEKLKEKLDKILEEETKLRERQKNRESLRSRTVSASDRARSGSIRHGIFSDPLSMSAVAQRPLTSSGKPSRARIDIHAEKPTLRVSEISTVERMEEARCPLCQSPLAVCSSNPAELHKRAAFCFSCRRSFTHGDLMSRE